MARLTIFIAVYFLFFACGNKPETSLSFYYWKTTFLLTAEEKHVLNQNGSNHLYIRYFDVVMKEGKPVPLSPVIFRESPRELSITPVIYIRNEVMLHGTLDVVNLAEKVVSYINQINTKNTIKSAGVQIDCDWTEGSKENYFQFLEQMRKKYSETLSVTIRLHQIKYPERTGIPPADKGVLMYYNMGKISSDDSNSIYERQTAQRYLARLREYPLHLDIALPVFRWGIHIRDNKVIRLLNKTNAETFQNDSHFKRKSEIFFEVMANTFKLGYYFQKGDLIKIESVQGNDLEEMASDLGGKLKGKPTEIIFYDLDNFNLKHYRHEENFFQKISSTF